MSAHFTYKYKNIVFTYSWKRNTVLYLPTHYWLFQHTSTNTITTMPTHFYRCEHTYASTVHKQIQKIVFYMQQEEKDSVVPANTPLLLPTHMYKVQHTYAITLLYIPTHLCQHTSHTKIVFHIQQEAKYSVVPANTLLVMPTHFYKL